MIGIAILAVIRRRLIKPDLGIQSLRGPFVDAPLLSRPSVRKILISELQVFRDFIPNVNVIAIIIHVRDLRIGAGFHCLFIHERNSGSEKLDSFEMPECTHEAGLGNRLGVEIFALALNIGQVILAQAGHFDDIVREENSIVATCPLAG